MVACLGCDNCRAAIVGRANSYLKPMFYIIIFSTCDVIALTIQAIGGSGAAQGEEQGTSTASSTHILVRSYAGTISLLGSGDLRSSVWKYHVHFRGNFIMVPYSTQFPRKGNNNPLSQNKGIQIICGRNRSLRCGDHCSCYLPCD
jgi:RTA1 like protein